MPLWRMPWSAGRVWRGCAFDQQAVPVHALPVIAAIIGSPQGALIVRFDERVDYESEQARTGSWNCEWARKADILRSGMHGMHARDC